MSDRPRAPKDSPQNPLRSPVERRIARSLAGESGAGKPLSRRARQTRRTLEAYLRAGGLPRYMLRLREIQTELALQRTRLERLYRRLGDECGPDAELFARRWQEIARAWRFDRLNELIREHNEWYPVEAQLPMDPRTRDYVRLRGRSYRRAELGPDWVLERFPPSPKGDRLEPQRGRRGGRR